MVNFGLYISICRNVYTNLGSFHKGPQLVCPSLCLQSFDSALSACQPNNDTKV